MQARVATLRHSSWRGSLGQQYSPHVSTTVRVLSSTAGSTVERRSRRGHDLSARYPLPITPPRSEPVDSTQVERPRTPIPGLDLSGPGQQSDKSREAANRIAMDMERKDVVQGVCIPVKPNAPDSDECCMSGCATCIYDIYAHSVVTYQAALDKARAELELKDVPRELWPSALAKKMPDGNDGKEVEIPGLDPMMSAFLALEKKLKNK